MYLKMKAVFFALVLLAVNIPVFSRDAESVAGKQHRTIYFFSGLGADSSAFGNLDLPGYRRVHISWIPPLPDESLAHYAGRIKSQITEEDPYIIGLSFGGIVAVEVARQMTVHKMALISSARTRDNIDRMQSFFMKLGLYRIIPGSLLKHTNFLTHSYFGAHTEKDKKALLKLLQGTDISFFRWGLKSVADWDNREITARTIQIHGTADKVIAYRLSHPDYSINGGGHLMVFNKADTISHIILQYFNDPSDPGTAHPPVAVGAAAP